MPTVRPPVPPLVVRRLAEPARDAQLLLAQVYEDLLRRTPSRTTFGDATVSLISPPGSDTALSLDLASAEHPTA